MKKLYKRSTYDSDYELKYQLVLTFDISISTLDDQMQAILVQTAQKIAGNVDYEIMNITFGRMWIEVIFEANPKEPLSKFINALKTSTSRAINKNRTMRFQWIKAYSLKTIGEKMNEVQTLEHVAKVFSKHR